MNIKLRILLFFSLLQFLSPTAYSSECLDMHVILYSPLGYINKDGQPTGIHWDFLQAIEQKSGICFNKKLIPYARIWKSMKYGAHDGGIIFRSSDRDNMVEYIAPIFKVNTFVIPRAGITIKNYQDLKKLKIGKIREIRLNDHFDNDPDMLFIEELKYKQLWKLLSRGRVDAIAGSEIGLIPTMPLEMKDRINLTEKYFLGERVQWLQLSKKSNHLDKIPLLKTTIEALLKAGEYKKIMAKHELITNRNIINK